ncbi:MAG: PfkB family carbohydrate kinase [Candidatus Helarchaeales archaeon]
MFDIVIIGHACIDNFRDPPASRLGGTVLYGGLTAANLGKKVGIVTPISSSLTDEMLAPFKHPNITLHSIPTKIQTEFTHVLHGDVRTLALEKKSPDISADLIPRDFFNTKLCFIAPICNEVELSVLESYSSQKVPIALELQGFVRKFDKNGRVTLKKTWNEAPRYLKHVKYVKGARAEALSCLGLGPKTDMLEIVRQLSNLGPEVVVITSGREGSHVYRKNFLIHIPPMHQHCVDRTGAGDTFFTAFILHAMDTKDEDMLATGLFASAAASFVIEDYGAKNFGSIEAIQQRVSEFLKR